MHRLIFFLTTAMQGAKSLFELLPGHFFEFGFCRARASFLGEEKPDSDSPRVHEGWLPTHISCILQGFACLTGRDVKILVSNGYNCVSKFSIHLAFSSKRALLKQLMPLQEKTYLHWQKINIYFPVQLIQYQLFYLELFWVCINLNADRDKLKIKNKQCEELRG